MADSHAKWSNNRSVMPLDVRGRTRATMEQSTGLIQTREGLGNPGNCFVTGIVACNSST